MTLVNVRMTHHHDSTALQPSNLHDSLASQACLARRKTSAQCTLLDFTNFVMDCCWRLVGWLAEQLEHSTREDLGNSIGKTLFLSEHKVICTKTTIPRHNFIIFMYLKWPWLLHFFAKMLQKQLISFISVHLPLRYMSPVVSYLPYARHHNPLLIRNPS